MRKGFQKLAAEMLVENSISSQRPPGAIITIDDGSSERRYAVDLGNLQSLEQEIDRVGDSPEEVVSKDSSRFSKALFIDQWIQACSMDEPETKNLLTKIFEENLQLNPDSINDFGKYQSTNLQSGAIYSSDNPLVLDLARFVPHSSALSRTTGPGEFAVAFLFGLIPERETGFDLVTSQTGGRQYTIKHSSKAPDLEAGKGLKDFIYKFKGRKQTLKKLNDDLSSPNPRDIKPEEAEMMYATKVEFGFTTTKDEKKTKQSRTPLKKHELAYVLLDLKPRNRRSPASTRWALICNNPPPKSQSSGKFTFKAFSLSNRLENAINSPDAASKIEIRDTQIKISESLTAVTLISELSRRDQQDVEAIARRIAQEVLEDELGDDFDKAVRREMLASLKDKEVESGVADVSRDFMRKFYRSLGTASSSPLDKVKV